MRKQTLKRPGPALLIILLVALIVSLYGTHSFLQNRKANNLDRILSEVFDEVAQIQACEKDEGTALFVRSSNSEGKEPLLNKDGDIFCFGG